MTQITHICRICRGPATEHRDEHIERWTRTGGRGTIERHFHQVDIIRRYYCCACVTVHGLGISDAKENA